MATACWLPSAPALVETETLSPTLMSLAVMDWPLLVIEVELPICTVLPSTVRLLSLFEPTEPLTTLLMLPPMPDEAEEEEPEPTPEDEPIPDPEDGEVVDEPELPLLSRLLDEDDELEPPLLLLLLPVLVLPLPLPPACAKIGVTSADTVKMLMRVIFLLMEFFIAAPTLPHSCQAPPAFPNR